MKIYRLASIQSDENGVPPLLETNYEKVPTDYYDDYITYTKFDNVNKWIYLELTKFEGGNLILRDFLRWGLGHPSAYFIVCSAKFSFTLQELNLPEYRLYKAEIDVLGKKHKYYVLHFIQEYLEDIDYEYSQFSEVALMENERVNRMCEFGEIKSETHFHERNKILIKDMIYLYPKKICFKPEINYDIYGLQGQIIITQHARTQIEKAGITGVEMPNIKDEEMFKDVEIIFSNQKQTIKKEKHKIIK